MRIFDLTQLLNWSCWESWSARVEITASTSWTSRSEVCEWHSFGCSCLFWFRTQVVVAMHTVISRMPKLLATTKLNLGLVQHEWRHLLSLDFLNKIAATWRDLINWVSKHMSNLCGSLAHHELLFAVQIGSARLYSMFQLLFWKLNLVRWTWCRHQFGIQLLYGYHLLYLACARLLLMHVEVSVWVLHIAGHLMRAFLQDWMFSSVCMSPLRALTILTFQWSHCKILYYVGIRTALFGCCTEN